MNFTHLRWQNKWVKEKKTHTHTHTRLLPEAMKMPNSSPEQKETLKLQVACKFGHLKGYRVFKNSSLGQIERHSNILGVIISLSFSLQTRFCVQL